MHATEAQTIRTAHTESSNSPGMGWDDLCAAQRAGARAGSRTAHRFRLSAQVDDESDGNSPAAHARRPPATGRIRVAYAIAEKDARRPGRGI
jgi:hypothetical protein